MALLSLKQQLQEGLKGDSDCLIQCFFRPNPEMSGQAWVQQKAGGGGGGTSYDYRFISSANKGVLIHKIHKIWLKY